MSHDGKYPVEPGFDHFVYYRNKSRKDLYPDTAGLLGHHGDSWYQVRSKVQQVMLRPKSAMFYLKHLEDISVDLCNLIKESLDENEEIADVLEYVNRWSLESIVAIFLDNRLHCLKKNLPQDSEPTRFVNAVKIATGTDTTDLAFGVPLWKLYPTPVFRRFDAAMQTIHDITKRMVDNAIADLKKRGPDTTGELSVLQKLINKCGPDSQIPIVMSQDAIMAGVDTTGTTAAFILLDLATNPDKQELLFQEINRVIGDGDVTESKLNQMKYLKACLHESQRLNPAILGMSRRTQSDMVLEGYQIPKNSIVSYFFQNAMRDPEQWTDPDQFQPERWLRGCPQHHSAHPYAHIIFSHGPRMCIGKRFAELEVYIMTIKIVQRFRLEYHHDEVGVATEFVNKPDKPIKMKFVQR